MHCEDCALSKGVIRVRDDLAVEIKCDRLLVQLGKAEVEVFPGRDSAPSECFGGGGGEAGGQDDPRGTACTSSCGGRVANDLLPASILGQSSKTGVVFPALFGYNGATRRPHHITELNADSIGSNMTGP